jgi:hypothetical protein
MLERLAYRTVIFVLDPHTGALTSLTYLPGTSTTRAASADVLNIFACHYQQHGLAACIYSTDHHHTTVLAAMPVSHPLSAMAGRIAMSAETVPGAEFGLMDTTISQSTATSSTDTLSNHEGLRAGSL